MIRSSMGAFVLFTLVFLARPVWGQEVMQPASERFAEADGKEVPDFQRHVLPLMGRLGCNSRACHGSFQGQGGFRLSLFGYDFKADHEALLAKDEGRVDREAPESSDILRKPTLAMPHKGGKRMEEGSWQHELIYRWIEAGAAPADGTSHFERLEVTPGEIAFEKDGQQVPLKVVAYWADGGKEDVTCLCRFQTNDETVAAVDATGLVTSKGAGDTHVVAFYDNGVTGVPVLRPVSDKVGANYPEVPARMEVDRLVVEKLKKLGIVPSEVCTDAEFLRRLSLDMTGSLPGPKEASEFIQDSDPEKRAKKVEELLNRPTYAAWWTNKLCDITGNTPRNFQGMASAAEMSRNWYEWMYRRIAENRPYDELIAGIVLGNSREPGQSYEDYVKEETSYYRKKDPADYSARKSMPYYWARRNQRLPEEKALAFSYAFLGVRLECAQCHKHPFDQWTQDDFNRFKAFFEPIRFDRGRDYAELLAKLDIDRKNGNNQIQRQLDTLADEGKVVPWPELLISRPQAPRPTKSGSKNNPKASSRVPTASVLGGENLDLSQQEDPRKPIMDWMRDPENPYFARAFVNRVWASYMGVGIIDPPDDSNLANPPSNEALLAYLTKGFVERKFDMKWLHREIVLSDAYQRSWEVNATNEHDGRNFSHALVRRMPAEALLDAIRQATASVPLLSKMLVDAELRSFGPAGTAAYGRGGADYASRVFGRSARDTNCDCSRSDEPNLLQAIYLQNDNDVLTSLERSDGWVAELQKADRDSRAGSGDEVDKLVTRIRFAEQRIRRLGDNKSTAEQRAGLQRELEKMRGELEKLKNQKPAEEKPAPEVAQLIDEAFLRTLSRLPTEEERSASRDYFQKSEDVPSALKDLLWALLNTKEFITNH